MSLHFRSNFDARRKERQQTIARYQERKGKAAVRMEQAKMDAESFHGLNLLAQSIDRAKGGR